MRSAMIAGAIAGLIAGLALGGCSRKPDFNQRYDAARHQLEAAAAAMDRDIAASATAGDPGASDAAEASTEPANRPAA